MAIVNYHLVHSTSGESIDASFDDTGSPGQMLEQLLENAWLKPLQKGNYVVVCPVDPKAPDGEMQQLTDKESFAEQGVPDGTTLTISFRAEAAAPRRTGPTHKRLRTDFRSLKDLEGRGCIGEVKIFADNALRSEVTGESDAARLRRFVVELLMPLPVASEDRERRESDWRLLFDLERDWKNYPSAKYEPYVTFLERWPWHHRVGATGRVCTRPVGSSSLVAGQIVGTIAGVMNGDEAFDQSPDHGYSEACYEYFRSFGGPLNPDLEVPIVRKSVFDPKHASEAVVAETPPTPRLQLTPSPRTHSIKRPLLVLKAN